jgi:hypothetical protein
MADELMGMPQQYDQIEQSQPEQTEQKQTEQPAQADTQKEQNWRMMRDRMESAERRAQELERMIQMNMNQQQNTKIQVTEEEDDFDLSDDTYIEGKHLKKYIKSLKKDLKETKEKVDKYNQTAVTSNAEWRLKSQFSDFDQVVSTANLEKLKSEKPALFRSIMSTQDIYDQGYSAYEMIKSSGYAENSYSMQDKKIEENKNKPRSSANVSGQTAETPMAKIGDYDRRILTEDRKRQLLKQVEEAKQLR